MTASPVPRSRAARRVLAAALLASSALIGLCQTPLLAQVGGLERLGQRTRDPAAKMVVTARELVYDYDRQTVSAVGDVRLSYGGDVLEADRVVYDQRGAKVRAYGNVRLAERGGNVIRAESLELTDDLREGFVGSLTVDTVERARFVAAEGRRTAGNVTVFDRALYTACEACGPEKPPLWQIRAARIIHDEKERTVYYEDAQLEFFGKPVLWLPFLSHPDPTVKRKTGFLPPRYIGSTELGIGLETPYFWAVAPNMDLTLAPTLLSGQGLLMKSEWRHRLVDGAYAIRAAGIFQADKSAFPTYDVNGQAIGAGDTDGRGAVQTEGRFHINERWSFGWDLNLVSDKWVLDDYDLWGADWSEAISTIHLTGIGERSYFDLRGYYFQGLSNDDRQEQLPIAAPVLDYNYIHDEPVLGGELAFNLNSASIHRQDTDFEPTSWRNTLLLNGTAPNREFEFRGQNYTCASFVTDCVTRGIGGSYTRLSGDVQWRRQLIDPAGQVWTPFGYGRGDVIWQDAENNPALANIIGTDQEFYLRGMGAAGIEYRYPFVAQSGLGTHMVEPIAQVIARPNEQHVGEIFNEDAQDLFFDDTTLFEWDKFSGYDRLEGGTRANVGAQYTLTMASGSFVNVLFGQSYHLLGENSFARPDTSGAPLQSGLETDDSDYVSRLYVQATRELAFATRFRFDQQSLDTRVTEIEGRFTKGVISGALIYGRYDEQPRLGFLDVREGVLGNAKLQLTKNLFVTGAARYDLDIGNFDATQIGIGYLDDCFALGLVYGTDYSKAGNKDPVHTVLVRFALRTLGDAGSSREFQPEVFGRRELRDY